MVWSKHIKNINGVKLFRKILIVWNLKILKNIMWYKKKLELKMSILYNFFPKKIINIPYYINYELTDDILYYIIYNY